MNPQADPPRQESVNLVLASTSVYRRELLERLGIPFRCVAPRFDEAALSRDGKTPRAVAEALAEGKAASISMLERVRRSSAATSLSRWRGESWASPGRSNAPSNSSRRWRDRPTS